MVEKNIVEARETFVEALVGDGASPALTHEHANAFARQLLKTLNVCNRHNVQLCSSFIIKYVAPWSARVAALGEYLIALSLDCRSEKPPRLTPNLIYRQIEIDAHEGLDMADLQRVLSRPMPSYRRLHVLYILHDVLLSLARLSHPAKMAQSQRVLAAHGPTDIPSMLRNLSPHAIRHVHYVACKGYCAADQAIEPLRQILAQWKKVNILPGVEHLEGLLEDHETRELANAEQSFQSGQEEHIKKMRKAHIDATKWHLPKRHGLKDDPSPLWYALPAANGLYMRRTRGYPMKYMAFPQGGYELKNGGKPTSEDLKHEVSWLHAEALHAFDRHPDPSEVADVDALGNIVWADPIRPTRNHWGRTHTGVAQQREIEAATRDHPAGYADVPAPSRSGPPNAALGDAMARARALAAQNRDAAPSHRGEAGFGAPGYQGRQDFSAQKGGYDRPFERAYGDHGDRRDLDRGDGAQFGDQETAYGERGHGAWSRDPPSFHGGGGGRGRGRGGRGAAGGPHWGGGYRGGDHRGGGIGGGWQGGGDRQY